MATPTSAETTAPTAPARSWAAQPRALAARVRTIGGAGDAPGPLGPGRHPYVPPGPRKAAHEGEQAGREPGPVPKNGEGGRLAPHEPDGFDTLGSRPAIRDDGREPRSGT
ncbi:hypothetical protein [Streptomyces sp. NPDC090445]|uniref:hypothetical protein n=1 Tax=Streptomyces sp. NPDC090445 TaxID=3365963 RepID=UPI0037F27C03